MKQSCFGKQLQSKVPRYRKEVKYSKVCIGNEIALYPLDINPV